MRRVFEVAMSMQHETGKTKAELDVNRFVDESVLDELEKEGFFKKVAGK